MTTDGTATRTCCIERSCGNYDARAVIDHLHGEIERLLEQIGIAHSIIGSEAMIWLIVGANHPQAHLDAMRSAVNTYWKTYGNAFRGPDKEDTRG